MKRYMRKPEPVQAELMTRENAEELAKLCNGTLGWKGDPINSAIVYPIISFRGVHGLTALFEGYYLVQFEDGSFDRRIKREFENTYIEDPPDKTNFVADGQTVLELEEKIEIKQVDLKEVTLDPDVAEAINRIPKNVHLTGDHIFGLPRTPFE